MTKLQIAAKKALAALEHDNPAGRTATIQELKDALADVPATDFGNMVGPIGWLEPPHGHFQRNPDFHFALPPQSLTWKIPVFLGNEGRHHARAKFEPVCKVRIHDTGGNAGLAWSPTGLEAWEGAPNLKGGTILYIRVED